MIKILISFQSQWQTKISSLEHIFMPFTHGSLCFKTESNVPPDDELGESLLSDEEGSGEDDDDSVSHSCVSHTSVSHTSVSQCQRYQFQDFLH